MTIRAQKMSARILKWLCSLLYLTVFLIIVFFVLPYVASLLYWIVQYRTQVLGLLVVAAGVLPAILFVAIGVERARRHSRTLRNKDYAGPVTEPPRLLLQLAYLGITWLLILAPNGGKSPLAVIRNVAAASLEQIPALVGDRLCAYVQFFIAAEGLIFVFEIARLLAFFAVLYESSVFLYNVLFRWQRCKREHPVVVVLAVLVIVLLLYAFQALLRLYI